MNFENVLHRDRFDLPSNNPIEWTRSNALGLKDGILAINSFWKGALPDGLSFLRKYSHSFLYQHDDSRGTVVLWRCILIMSIVISITRRDECIVNGCKESLRYLYMMQSLFTPWCPFFESKFLYLEYLIVTLINIYIFKLSVSL